jgi:alginate O-acetyltransferase complex protein AlgI
MLFYEPFFLGVFFPTLYAAYLALNERVAAKKWMLLLASVAFYSWGEPLFVPVLIASTLIDYRLVRLLHRTKSRSRHILMTVGIVGNLAVLGFYKYADFLAANLNVLLLPLAGVTIPLLHIALPIGVSFVVFEKITYLVDTYRGTSAPAPRFADYFLFVFFFPKLLAGPILKYHDMQQQIAEPAVIGWDDFSAGFLRFARGMAKKLLIADPVGTFADQVFTADPGSVGFGPAWFGLICFTLQIYFDFSGYSDMAIGLARMLGFRLRENFDMPYISRSLTEFWRRWHISLSSWTATIFIFRSAATGSAPSARTSIYGSAFSPAGFGTVRRGILSYGVPITGCFSRLTACFCCARSTAAVRWSLRLLRC